MSEEVWTPLRLINWTREYFEKQGIDDARLEAELLLASALGCKRIDLYARFNEQVPPDRLASFRRMVKRRASREPTQYVLERTEFCGLVFKTDRRALIPRPETEMIIEVTAELLKDAKDPLLADVGAGSGVLAVTAAVRFPQARLVACDISAEALSLARENAASHRVLDRIALKLGDFVQTLGEYAGRVDVAMANPPYLSEAELEGLAPEVRSHEPVTALAAGPAGTEIQQRLLEFAPVLLKLNGHLVMEMGAGQARRIRDMTGEIPSLDLVRTEKDFAGIERIALIRKRS